MSDAAAAPPSSRRVLTGYFTLAGLYTLSAAAIWGVNTLFLLDAGLSFFEVFVANAAFSAGMVAFEVPTGVVADTLGRRVSFLLSVSVLAATTLIYVGLAEVGAGVVAFSLVSVAMGLGFTFYSGAMEAWLVDALHVTGYAGALDAVFARGQQITGAAMLVGTVGGGLLGQIDLSLPYLVRSALLVAVFAVAYVVMHDLGFTPRRVTAAELPGEVARNARAGVAYGWGQRPLRLLMLASLVQMGFLQLGVLRLPAVPARSPLERRGVGRGARDRGHRPLDHRRQPARGRDLAPLRAADDAPARSRRGRDRRGRRPWGSSPRSGPRCRRSS